MENTASVQQPVKQTKICKYCKSEIPKDAKICPHCRKRVAMGTFGKLVAILFGVVVLAAVIGSSSSSSNSSPKPAISAQDAAQIGAEVDAWKKTPAGQLCAKHDTWSRIDCDLVVANKVNVGMSYSALVYMRGKPDSTNVSNYGSGNRYQYCWTDRTPSCFYDDNNDGILDSYN